VRPGILLAGALVLLGSGCLSILGGDVDFDGKPGTGGTSTTSSTTTTSSSSSSSSSGGTCYGAPSTKQCSDLTCSNGMLTQPGYCNGAGACNTPAAAACAGGFACADGTTCKTSCTADTDCAGSGLYCQSGQCVGTNPAGTACSGNDQCAGGSCVDGFCCNTSCAVECMGCSMALTGAANGTCATVINGTADPRNLCPKTSESSCSTDGTCTSGACEKWPSTTVCGSPSCTNETEVPTAYCSGTGTCGSQTPASCGSFACGATACNTTCTSSADCASGFFCWLGACTQLAAVAAGDYHTCALTKTGAVQCWGNGSSGQLGTGTLNASSVPVAVSGLSSGVVSIAVGLSYSCAVKSTGAVYCWGGNGGGQLSGSVSGMYSAIPVQVSSLASGAVSVAAGGNFACALLATGAVSCWGSGTVGQLGDGLMASASTPVSVEDVSSVAVLFTGALHGCVSESTGGIFCWGGNTYGQLGDGSTANSSMPYDVADGTFLGVGGGAEHTCVLGTSGGVQCFGGNSGGQLGNGTTTDSDFAVNVNGSWSAIGAGSTGYHTCALDTAHGAWCWGDNSNGQLGDSSTTQANAPVAVVGLTSGVASISPGEYHTCAVTTAGLAQCWGSNSFGQLGNNATIDSSVPVPVSEP
jgi:alpha-tubulin suppressor-like RCC1 family protein